MSLAVYKKMFSRQAGYKTGQNKLEKIWNVPKARIFKTYSLTS